MKYLPTINLWDNAMHSAVTSGRLKLQPGQWVRCGQSQPSRWVGIRSGGRSLLAVHPHGARGVSQERFKQALQCWT